MTRAFVPRKGAPKSRGGCFTCKVRRIKCDETRPLCSRCTSTGRKCDGYSDQCGTTVRPDPNLTALTISTLSGDTNEQRSFQFFQTCTVPNISLHFRSLLWSRLVLQASQSEPGLRHAAVALGALHEHLESQKIPGGPASTDTHCIAHFAAQQYTQALILLRNLLTKSDSRSIELAFIGALLCMYYEALQENFETAQIHLENCLNVLIPLLPGEGSWLTNQTENKMQIDNDVIQAFARLDIEASCTLGKRSPSLCITSCPLVIPNPFTSLNQARQYLYALTSHLHTFMRNTADSYKATITPIPLPTLALANMLQSHLKEWSVSFSAFLSLPTTRLSRQEQQGANILSIQQKVTYMKAANSLYAEEMVFDQFDQDFEEILCLAEYVVYISSHLEEQEQEQGRLVGRGKVVTFEMGIIEALFWTAIKCRCHKIRHRAIEILKKITWQEGVWNAEMMAALAASYVEIEKQGAVGVVVGEERIPEWLRLHDHGWEMNPKARRVEIRAGRRENGADGEWSWVREEVVW